MEVLGFEIIAHRSIQCFFFFFFFGRYFKPLDMEKDELSLFAVIRYKRNINISIFGSTTREIATQTETCCRRCALLTD